MMVILAPLLVIGQQNNSIASGDGSGVFDSISILSPTSTTAVVIAPSTSAIGNINPTPLIGSISNYITSEQSNQFVGMKLYYMLLLW